jgi:hypothetical protein
MKCWIFFTIKVKRIGVGAGSGVTAAVGVGAASCWCSDSYPLAYIVTKSKSYVKLLIFSLCLGKSIEFWAGARTGAALCWCGPGMKKWSRSGSGFDSYPLVYGIQWKKSIFGFFPLFRPMAIGRSQSQNRSCIMLVHFRYEKMMLLLFWLQLLLFLYCIGKKSKIDITFLWFYTI